MIYRLILLSLFCAATLLAPAQSNRGKNRNKTDKNRTTKPWEQKDKDAATAHPQNTDANRKPGTYKIDTNYFQQQVNYNIRVKLNDVNHTLNGFETIEYKNNSPHTLKYIYFHVWPNAYKNNETQLAKQLLESGETDFYFAPESERGFIDSLLFKVGNDTLKWAYDKKKKEEEDKKSKEEEYIDIVKVTLKKPLPPDSTVIITTPFYVKIPSGLFSRLGHIGQSYQITQWFPKPAVYDKNGWNQMPYLNQGEFYSEYGNFDVSITVPANYLVAATGELKDCPQEERMLELKAKETQELFKNNSVDKYGNLMAGEEFPPSSTEWKTLRFVQKNVHDFAWFADKRWAVLKGEYEFAKSGKLVSLWSFFTPGNSRYWKKSIQYLHDAIHYYSKWNGDYPYSIVTAVDGTISAGGGMEYPTITNIGEVGSDITLETVIMHEVGHNWFYGILGSNEREHPWMDEGLNSANEMRYMATKYPELTLANTAGLGGVGKLLGIDTLKQRMSYYLAYQFVARTNDDQPIEEKAREYTDFNYGAIVYYKTAAAFNFLRDYLGEKLYDQCMHAYFEAWKFKHPQPNDLRRVFESVSKKDLGWFFEELVKTNKIIDYQIKAKRKPNTKSTKTFGWMVYEEGVAIENKGGLATPFCLVGITADTVAAKKWYPGFTGRDVVAFPNGNYDRIVIDPFYTMPEINQRNNTLKYKIKGKRFLPRFEKVKLKFLVGVDNPKRSMLYWTPVVGANVYDGVMAGLAFYNSIGFQKPFEFTVMPMYAFKSQQPVGSFSVAFHSNNRTSTWLKSIDIGANGVHYSTSRSNDIFNATDNFYRVDPYVRFNFKPKTPRSVYNQNLTLKYNYVVDQIDFTCPTCTVTDYNQVNSSGYADVEYRLGNKTTLMPQQLYVRARYGMPDNLSANGDFAQVTADYTISRVLNARGKKVSLRFYAGAFLFNDTQNGVFNLRGDGIRGPYDYTYSQTFIGRIEYSGLWAQQFAEGYANIKTPTNWAQSNKWNASVNLDADLPIPLFKIFADAGFAPFNTAGGSSLSAVADAGIYLELFGGALNVYMPLWVSGDINREYKTNGTSFAERIRFSLNIQPFTPQRIAKTVKLF